MNILKKLFPFIIILIFSFFAYKPLLNTGFFPIHDDTQVARVLEMTKALKDGMFPVRWSQDLGYGYGYPIFNFYDPLPYYVGGVMGILGLDALISTKLMVILAIIFSGFSMYLLSREFFGLKGALFSSALYVFAPFHAIEVYVRGDFAENFAYAFIPLVFYGLFKIYKNYKWKYMIIAAISYGGLILSHNLTAMMVTPFLLITILLNCYIAPKGKKILTFYRLFSALLIGLALSAFYFLPAIFEMKFTDVLSQIGGGANFRDHFVCLSQLWTSQWGFGGSTKGCIDGISFMIGKYHILLSLGLFLISVFFLFSKKYSSKLKKEKENLYLIVILFLGLLISVFFMLQISKPVWELIYPMEFFQYPWRFLIMASFFVSLLSGALFWFMGGYIKDKNVNLALSFLIFIFIIFVSIKFFAPQSVLNKSSADYTSKYSLNWQASKISDEYLPKGFSVPESEYQIPDVSNLTTKELRVEILERKTQYIKLNLNVIREGNYILPFAYFPAWQARIDGKQVNIAENSKGSVVNLPNGKHILELNFIQTPIEKASNFISLVGILLLFVGIIHLPKRKYDKSS